jgi:predicted TIM-barrel fold metal-dependent hydrolase
MANFKIVSTDSHVTFPIAELAQRVPKEYREQVQQIRFSENPESEEAQRAKRKRERSRSKYDEDDLVRHARMERDQESDVERRIKDQDLDGVCAEVVFGPLFTHDTFANPEVDMAIARAYNQWAAEHFGAHPNRFAPSAALTATDIPTAVAEVEKLAKMGYRCVNLPAVVLQRPYNRPDYDPLWAAIQETGLVANFHIGTGRNHLVDVAHGGLERGPGGPFINYVLFGQGDGPFVVTYLCTSGVCQRFPNLKWAVVESGAAWLAWVLTSMDQIVRKHHFNQRPQDALELLPSEYFKRQGHACFMDDAVAVQNRNFTGAHTIMFGTDYPHHEGTFPHTQEAVQRIFADVPEKEIQMMVGGNAAKLYGFSL